MNRIRQFGDKWQVLITPVQPYNPSFEILRGYWTDEHLRNFYIKEFVTLGDAQCEAYKYPDIEWIKMVIMHKDAYHDIKEIIKEIMEREKFIADFESIIMDPEMVKEAMFNRVMNKGRRFTLVNNMNDIISYHIVNPWTKNVFEIADKLMMDGRLRIFKRYETNGIIHLIGMTDVGTTYEIGIWPTLLSQWAKWAKNNPNINIDIKREALNKMIKAQKEIDMQYKLR